MMRETKTLTVGTTPKRTRGKPPWPHKALLRWTRGRPTLCPDPKETSFSVKEASTSGSYRASETSHINIGVVCGKEAGGRCLHPLEVVHQPWVMRAILTGAKAWKDDSWKANGSAGPAPGNKEASGRKRCAKNPGFILVTSPHS
ncbi:hypothetical protein CK203_084297 [Vitis vinifera]|uniref:Uncharacterized protein n=1 Tax=Vitis vinifera TaxID=29760 RepID=A0A438BML2_VITVI|nr:hypothetical protein CK203_084297 [Vitis vinifera]